MDVLWTKYKQNEKTWTESMFQCVSLSLCHGWTRTKHRQNEKTWTESMFQCVSLSLCHGWIMDKA